MKSVKYSFFGIFVLILGFFPANISAADLRMESTVNISESNSIGENLYIGAVQAIILGTAKHDTAVVSGKSVLAGVFEKDVISISIETVSEGQFNEDLRIVGPNVVVSSEVAGDLFVAGGNVLITKEASIGGDLVVIAGNVNIEGDIKGKTKIVAGLVNIAGTLQGRAAVTTQKLTVGPGAKTLANVFYFAPERAVISSDASIEIPLKYNAIGTINDSQFLERALLSVNDFWILFKFVTTLVMSFILVYVFKVFSQSIVDLSRKDFWRMLVFGFVFAFLIPILALVFMISLFALPIGLILLLFYAFLFIVTPALSGILIGMVIIRLFHRDHHEISFVDAMIGVVALIVIQFIPLVGSIFSVIMFLVSVGSIVYYLHLRFRGKKSI